MDNAATVLEYEQCHLTVQSFVFFLKSPGQFASPPNKQTEREEERKKIEKMMNVLSLFLVLSSLAAAGVFSPHPTTRPEEKMREEVVVKEGHRVIMVEYERELVPLSQDQPNLSELSVGIAEKAKEKIREASQVLPETTPGDHTWHPRDLICDASGKCKHKLAGAFDKAKEKVSEKAHQVEEGSKEAGEAVKHKGQEITQEVEGGAKEASEAVKQKAQEIKHVEEGAKETGESVKQRAQEITHEAEEAKEAVKKMIQQAGEAAKEASEAVKQKAQKFTHKVEEGAAEAKDALKQKGQKVSHQAGEACESVKQEAQKITHQAEETAKEAKETLKQKAEELHSDLKTAQHSLPDERSAQQKASELIKETRRNFSDYFQRRIESAYNATKHATSSKVTNPVMSVVHLLGFAIAYGASVWVTFVSSHVLAGALPRQQFGMVQSKIYPVYFKTIAVSVGCSVMAYMFVNRDCLFRVRNYRKAEALQMCNMVVALALVVFNLLYLEPRATKVMFERMKVEKEEGNKGRRQEVNADDITVGRRTEGGEEERKARMGKLNMRLKKLNSASSVLNVVSLMGLTWHLVHLAQRLEATS